MFYMGEALCSGALVSLSCCFLLEYLFALAANKITPSPIKTPTTIPYVKGASAIVYFMSSFPISLGIEIS
jgi:hypothetical protein